MSEEKKIEQIKEQVKKRVQAEAAAYPDPPADDEISSKFVRDCLAANELGDGVLFAKLLRDKFLYNTSEGTWLKWNGHHWERDELEDVLTHVESVVDVIIKEISKIGEEISWALKKQENKRVDQLERLRKDCREYDPHKIRQPLNTAIQHHRHYTE